jgi:hypothetical protein
MATWYTEDPQYPVTPIGSSNNASGATLTLTGVTVPSGSLIVVGVIENAATANGTLGDGGTNTYGVAKGNTVGSGNSGWCTLFFIANCGALSNATITFTKQNTGAAAQMSAVYVGSVATASAQDATVTVAAVGNSTSAASGNSGIPGTNAELMIGLVASSGSSAPGSPTGWCTAFANGVANASLGLFFGEIRGGLAPVSLTSAVASANWAAVVVGFKPVATPTGYSGVNGWAASTTYVCGALVRQSALPALGSECVFACIASTSGTGTSGASEPSWSTSKGTKTTDNTVTWMEVTGNPGVNNDNTNTPNCWHCRQRRGTFVGRVHECRRHHSR